MHKIFILSLVLLCLKNQPFAQVDIKISELSIPTSPGLVLADKSPASIEKPTNPKAFGISLLNLREGGAVEVTPFWLVNHSAFSFEDYFKKRFPIISTFNLSGATFKTDSTSVLSLGFRTQIVRIYSKNRQDAILSIKKKIVDILASEEIDQKTLNDIESARKELNGEKSKVTFNIEIAAAFLGSSTNSSFKNLSSDKSGVWANIRYRPNTFPLDLTALTRYSWANNASPKMSKDSAFFDYGLSLSYQKTKFDISLEYINRSDLSINSSSDRFAIIANYALSENIIIVGSFGKNFENVGNILSVIGVKLGFSNEKIKIE